MSSPITFDNSDFANAFATASYDTPLTVNDVEYPLVVGTTTQFGYYKNGYQVRTIIFQLKPCRKSSNAPVYNHDRAL
jgi:hypothetical protein